MHAPSRRALVCALVAVVGSALPARTVHAQRPSTESPPYRTIAIDERLASDLHLHVGDTVGIGSTPDVTNAHVVIAAITKRGADPSEIARGEYRVRLHLDDLQGITSYGDRVDRVAVATRRASDVDSVQRAINDAAFGFHAYRSRDIAVRTSRTFQVVGRFHRAIGIITIVASSIFLLCIMLLKVEERRRDVAALRLIGISRASVTRSVVIEAGLVAVLGSVLGTALGWLASTIVNVHYESVYRTPLRFAIVTPDTVLLAVALSLVLGIGAGLLAARRLVRTPPLELFGR